MSTGLFLSDAAALGTVRRIITADDRVELAPVRSAVRS